MSEKSSLNSDKSFVGSIPQVYDQHLVPLIFEPYAEHLAQRLAARPLTRVLEIAAGTGVVTRRLAGLLPEDVAIVATDLNQAMLDRAAAVGTPRTVEWRQADALRLPFADAAFDAVVCQFGVMFFPDKAAAFAEARRVLKPGGLLLFNSWDRIEQNLFAALTTEALATLYPDDPPRFLARVPHGYHDIGQVRLDLQAAGFSAPAQIETLARRSRAASGRLPALAYCQGTPLRSEIEARGGAAALQPATEAAAAAIAACCSNGQIERPVDGLIQAHVVAVER